MLAKTANDSLQLDPAIVEMLLVIYGVIMLFAVVVYLLQAVGLYSVAKRRRIPRPWLAFLPIGESWILGSISDRYQFVRNKRYRNRKKLLVCTELTIYALCSAIYFFFGSLLINMQTIIATYKVYIGWYGKPIYQNQTVTFPPRADDILAAEQLVLVLLLAAFLLSIIFLMFRYFACYDYYASCRPDLKVVFLVLSIVFPVTIPFFVFACRKHDLGLQEQPEEQCDPAKQEVQKVFAGDP